MVTSQVLLLGAGELGTAFLPHLSVLPDTHITVAVRNPSKYAHLAQSNIFFHTSDHSSPVSELAEFYAKFDIIISCTGFGQPPGTQIHLANAVLAAGELKEKNREGRLWYFPWQWGVDYDITGDGDGLMPLFGEQLAVRTLLREKSTENNVKWTILSTGIFMSFLFENFWGIVEKDGDEVTVRALNDWQHGVTVTHVNDIGKVVARVVHGDVESENRVLFAAGDSVSYEQLVGIVERVTGKKVKREKWDLQHLRAELVKDPDDMIKKYRLVFAGDGVRWDKEKTVNAKLSITLTDVESWAGQNLNL